ncbi:erythromycin esterase family protein [Adhaeribacter rhizoryzae]|uniref:Erythromycin esterase family protein n=1 Tax=Adhaeribacter rhizoryzae TaxID=2607907 RepID=A0A5M6DHQ4_9BACT|nr:erythromycin esterase family protein [Adhaeribacter rhizoryzae]KAA5545729.1 erythromycin esterase family protein [Adhaeribacter rhizoryzae]
MANIPHYPLQQAQDLDLLIQEIGDARIVLLGEASHGTSEYYTWRTAISKRLIQEKGFSFISVEGDWPDCFEVNNFIKGQRNDNATALEVLATYNRWPTWMWGNWEVAALADWLKQHNNGKPEKEKVGFYGLDVYSLWDSLQEILAYLEKKDGAAVAAARKAFRCFEPYSEDPQEYARAVAFVSQDCEDEVVNMLHTLRTKGLEAGTTRESDFDAEQNALVAVNAEKYYRAMIRGGGSSWNVRDRHMMETLTRLLDLHGPNSKAIIWEHNTHVGDARYTDMARAGMINVGQLAREQYGEENVYIVGFGSYKGSVIAADEWGEPMAEMEVPAAPPGTWEYMLHEIGANNKLIFSKDLRNLKELEKSIGHRAIGVVYHPRRERFGNYVPTIIPRRYDAFAYIDTTRALHPLAIHQDHTQPPELYPWAE